MIKLFNLKLHEDLGSAGVEGTSTAPANGSQAPTIVLGKPDVTAPIPAAPAAPVADPASEWNGVKEKYKDQYANDVKANVERRLKGSTKEKREMMAILDPLTKYFGLPDMKTLKAFVHQDLVPTINGYQLPTFDDDTDDGGSTEPEAMPSPADLAPQAVELAQKYPDFDLEKDFEALTPLLKRGLDLETAYKVLNFDQILQKETVKAAEAQRKATIEAIRTRGLNAVDEQVSKPAPAVVHKTDPSTWSDAELDKAYRDAIRGVKIKL
jgi:hypothetical protein